MKRFKLKKYSDKKEHSALQAMPFFTTGKNFTKILILSIFTILIIGGFAPRVFADTPPLSVQFVQDPLFDKPNFLPEDEASGTVTVTNNSGSSQTILTEANHVLDNDHFGNLLNLKIVGTSGTLFDNTLAYFLTTAGEYSLGTIANGETKTFTYTVTFINSSDNSYQGKTLGFDVCVGFQGGNATNCGNTAIGNENGGGGGGSSGSTILIISNEQAINITNVDGTGSATITWNTNKLATSQVIYGLAPGPYTLTLTPPNYGYPFYTIEDETKVIDHSMFLTGLTSGATYVFRVVSKASPATVSYEHQFTIPMPAGEDNGLVLGDSTGPIKVYNAGSVTDVTHGSVLGASTENTPPNNTGNNLGAYAGFNALPYLLILFIILIILFILFYLRKKKKNNQ